MKRGLGLVVINIAVFCVLAELLGLGTYYFQHGWLFYSHDPRPYPVIAESEQGRLTSEGLHPYFGFTHRPGAPFEIPDDLQDASARTSGLTTNNFGFVARQDYPVARTNPRQFFIGIFGGSVGVWFCQVGTARLVELLERNTVLKDRDLVPLCFAHEGYKQPQQFLTLAYFLNAGQELDLVLNIDGFNEVALSGLNDQRGLDISMPSVQHIEPLITLANQATLTPEKLKALAGIVKDKERLNRLALSINRARFASVYVSLEQYYRLVETRYRRATVEYDKLPPAQAGNSMIQVNAPVRTRPGTSLFTEIAAGWARSSVLMRELLAVRGVQYIHVLQPNQYYTTRTFSRAEASVAVGQGSPYKDSAAQGYPALIEAAASNAAMKGVFFDGTRAFDTEPRPVYYDNCCHYTRVGYQRLAEFAAAAILQSPGPWNSR